MAVSPASQKRLALLYGHYEGMDERIREYRVTDVLSIDDNVLTGRMLAAMVGINAIGRLIPGVPGADEDPLNYSFAFGLLEGPQYTRAAMFRRWKVPRVPRSGHQAVIEQWKADTAQEQTGKRRPDLLKIRSGNDTSDICFTIGQPP